MFEPYSGAPPAEGRLAACHVQCATTPRSAAVLECCVLSAQRAVAHVDGAALLSAAVEEAAVLQVELATLHSHRTAQRHLAQRQPRCAREHQ